MKEKSKKSLVSFRR